MERGDERYKIARDKRRPKIDSKIIKKQKDNIARGEAYESLLEHYGWKLLMEEFLEKRLHLSNFLTAKTEELPDIRAKMTVLKEMLEHIKGAVRGTRASEHIIEKLRQLNNEEEIDND